MVTERNPGKTKCNPWPSSSSEEEEDKEEHDLSAMCFCFITAIVMFRHRIYLYTRFRDVISPKTHLSRGYRVSANKNMPHVRFEILTAVTMKNGVFWDVAPCCSCKNKRLGGT
jgi:hypothetical protein